MLISIKRLYVGSGLTAEILLNTRYVYRIESIKDSEVHAEIAKTRILCERISKGEQALDIIYTNDTITSIKSKVTRARKNSLEED